MKNINPNIWGPSAWKFLHYITLAYPENPSNEIKDNYINFFTSLKNVLPCEKCRINYTNKLSNYPINANSGEELVDWLIDIHNDVNKTNQKHIFSRKDFEDEYINMSLGSAIDIMIFILFILTILILGGMLLLDKIHLQQFISLIVLLCCICIFGKLISKL